MKTLNEELEAVKDDNTIIGAKPPKVRTLFDVVKTGNYSLEDFKKSKEFIAPEFESDINVRVREGISRGVQDIKNVPQGVEIFGGQVEMKIGGWAGSEETVERGRNLIKTAIDELDAKEKNYYQSAIPMSSKDYESLSFGLGQGITNYGAMLATGYLGGTVAGIGSMAVLEGTQKAQEKIGYYTEKTGDKELKGYTPEQAGKDVALTAIYTAGSAIMEKKLGYGAQRKLFKMPIGEKVKNVTLTALSEGGTETLQELYATGIDFVGGYIDSSKLPERFLGAVQEGVIGGILGGTAGIAAAVNHRSQAKQILRENLQNTVPEKDLENVVNAVYESTSDSMANIITQELAQSEQLRNKHGAIYESLKSEVAKQIQDNGAYSGVDEMKLSQYIEGTAKQFADQVLGEANKRNTLIDNVLKSSEIVYKDGRLYLQGASQQTKLKRLKKKRETKTPSMLQFIRLNGGIRDDGGKLKNMDAGKQFIGLVNKNGVDVDEMGEKLWESGYFMQRPTPAEVLDFIDDELKGVKHYPLGYVKQGGISQDENEAMLDNAISEYADIMGYDLSKMSYDEKTEIYAQMQKNLFADETQEVEPEETEDFDFADNEFFQVADENARLDDIYPEYKGETINIDGKEKTVYNSNGERIAKSKEALENFYKWFGDSKVVDKQGKPLVVYHGTEENFNIFKGSAFNFTRDRSVAQTYGNKIVAVYLKSNNNIEIDFDGRSAVYFLGKLMNPQEIIDKIIEIKSDINNHYNIDDEVMEELKNLGFEEFSPDSLDGIVFKNVMDNFGLGGKSSENYVVFNPNQIKSTSNRGTYSESENIYYQWEDIGSKTRFSKSKSDLKKLLSMFPPRGDYRLMYDADKGYWFVTDSMELIHQDILKQAWRSGLYPEFSREWEVQNFFDEKTYEDDTLYRFVAQGYENNNYMKKIENMGDDYTTAYVVPTKDGNGVVIFARGLGELADAGIGYLEENAKIYDVQTKEEIKPETYYQEDDRDLVALHSISASNLEKAIDFGGFPVPSIAIVKKGQEFHFDDLPITLVGNKEMIDPYDERNEVYNRDVWTKTFPWVTYKKPTQAKEKSFKNKIGEYYKRTNSENELGSFIYVAQRGDTSSALSQFQSSSGAMLYYLENIKKQKVEFAEKDLASDILERAGIDETLANEIQGLDVDTDRDKITKAFKRFLERKEEDFSDIKDTEKREKMIKFSRKLANENYFDKESGNIRFNKADTIVTAADNYFRSKGKKFIDQYEVRRQLRDMIANDENYQEWATEFFEKELVGDKMVRVGNALKPFTLENVVDAMTTGATVASQETPLPAMGKVVAAGAKRLETIRDIKEEGKKLVTLEQSKENMEKVKETLYDFLNMFEKGDDFSRNMDRKDAVATALQGVLKNKNITKESLKKAILRQLPSDKTVSDEVLSYGVELANEIKGLARYYFEAKPQRAVGLNEFSAAIMPTSTEFDTIAKKVEDAGLKVIRSDDQVQALRDLDAEDRVFFQSAFAGSRVDYDRPSLEAIGSGEGNQAHGWGLYYALDRDVAEGYRERFTTRGFGKRVKSVKYNGKEIDDDATKTSLLGLRNTNKENAIDLIKRRIKYADDETRGKWEELKDFIENVDESKIEVIYEKGQVHEVDIPENPYLLDEQKTFAEQSDFVKEKMVDLMLNETLKETNASKEKRNEVAKAMEKWTGGHFYQHFAVDLKSDKAASQLLEKYGIKGITYDGRQDGRCFVIFNPDDVKVIQKFYQVKNLPKQKGKIKGAFDALTKSIEITSEADFSTYQHEFAHFWLDNIWDYVKSGKASESYKKQFEELNKWLDVKPNQRYYTREQTEKFARGYEKFLYEGKIPNPVIGGVFEDYREFIKEVYESAEDIDVRAGEEYEPLSQEARNFFNTMITGKTEEQAAEQPEEEKPQKEVTEKPTEEKAEEKPRGLAKTTAEMAKKQGIEVEKPTYEVRKQTEMAKKADEFIKENKQLAIDIVKGLAPEQDGIFRQDLFAALREIALNEGDSDLLNDLSRSMTVEEATELGQRIQALARGRINPVKEMVELRDDRMKKNKVTKEKIKEETKKATKEINNEIALAAEPKEWQEFIKSLEC